jgi:hypothetical protein
MTYDEWLDQPEQLRQRLKAETRWERNFYPVPASTVPKEHAIEHSLRKWQGMRPAILSEHGVIRSLNMLVDRRSGAHILSVDTQSCALCQHHYRATLERDPSSDGNEPGRCPSCPLVAVLGRACDADPDEGVSPWDAWAHEERDPEPMISALKSALKRQKKLAKGTA